MVAVVVAVVPVAAALVVAEPCTMARGVLLASDVDSQRLAVHPISLHACRPTAGDGAGGERGSASGAFQSGASLIMPCCERATWRKHQSTKQHFDKQQCGSCVVTSYPQTAAGAQIAGTLGCDRHDSATYDSTARPSLTVECLCCLLLVGKGDEAEALAQLGVSVTHNVDLSDLTIPANRENCRSVTPWLNAPPAVLCWVEPHCCQAQLQNHCQLH